MSGLSLGLVLTAAMLHASWNLLVKKSSNKYIFTWWSVIVGVVVFSPLLLRADIQSPLWLYLFPSAVLEAVYFVVLSSAFEKGDFSLVYPIARGAAPIFLLLWSTIFLQERPSERGLVCIAAIVAGLVLVGGSESLFKERRLQNRSAIVLALFVSFLISLYSIIDAAAVRQVDPLPYIILVFSLTALLLTPFMVRRYGWAVLKQGFLEDRKHIAFAGIMSVAAYLLTLFAYQRSKVSYVGAVREVSIVFGAFAGWVFLKEAFGKYRIVGACVIFLGILIMALSA